MSSQTHAASEAHQPTAAIRYLANCCAAVSTSKQLNSACHCCSVHLETRPVTHSNTRLYTSNVQPSESCSARAPVPVLGHRMPHLICQAPVQRAYGPWSVPALVASTSRLLCICVARSRLQRRQRGRRGARPHACGAERTHAVLGRQRQPLCTRAQQHARRL